MSIIPDQFKDQVQATLQTHGMLRKGDRVLVAVSGGPDSVALLDILNHLGFAVEVAHLDHQTRGGDSAQDAQFVRELASALRVPFHLSTHPVAEEAAALGKSFEQHARDVRYAFLEQCARQQGCDALATGHHRGDVVETVMMRLLRGTTPGGLAGIPPVREQGGLKIVRPLIECDRALIFAWLEASGLPSREDSSNRDPRFLRNRIRHDLLPRLRHDYNPQVDEAVLRLAEAARVENDYVYRMAEKAFTRALNEQGALDRAFFATLHEALQRRIVLLFAWRHGTDCPFERVVDAVQFIGQGPVGNQFNLGGDRMLYNGRTHTELISGRPARDDREVQLHCPGAVEAFGLRFTVQVLTTPPEGSLSQYCTPLRQVFDADTLGLPLSVRHRRDGDRFTPLGLGGAKKIQDYFVDTGVPLPARDVIPLLIAGDRIAWIVGHATSDLTAVRPETKSWIVVEVTPCD